MYSVGFDSTQQLLATLRSGRAIRQFAVGIFLTALFCLLLLGPANAQTSFTTLHTFVGNGDGYNPIGDLVADSNGALYGVERPIPASGGVLNQKVFMLTPPVINGGSWTNKVIYNGVVGALILGPHGELYGAGVSTIGSEIFELVPPSTQGGTWTHQTLYTFQGAAHGDGTGVAFGQLALDAQGNLYGATPSGGFSDTKTAGTVFELSPPKTVGGAWTETVLYKFSSVGKNPFYQPRVNVVLGPNGELYGTCTGAVYQLKKQNGVWTPTVINGVIGKYTSQLTVDAAGNVFGTDPGYGEVFEFSPPTVLGGTWTLTLLNFPVQGGIGGDLALAGGGVLYGNDPYRNVAYKLTPNGTSWTYTTLHTFLGGSEGLRPAGRPLVDSSGHVFGTTTIGGTGPCNPHTQYAGCGTVWELQ